MNWPSFNKHTFVAAVALLAALILGVVIGLSYRTSDNKSASSKSTVSAQSSPRLSYRLSQAPHAINLGNVVLTAVVIKQTVASLSVETASGNIYDFSLSSQSLVQDGNNKVAINSLKANDIVQVEGQVQRDGSLQAYRVSVLK